MPINYTVLAEVVDITADIPKNEDIFLVDTNVWYWMTYSRASQSARPPAHYQISKYPNYTNSALSVGARIFQSGLSLAELTHLIEKLSMRFLPKRILPFFQIQTNLIKISGMIRKMNGSK